MKQVDALTAQVNALKGNGTDAAALLAEANAKLAAEMAKSTSAAQNITNLNNLLQSAKNNATVAEASAKDLTTQLAAINAALPGLHISKCGAEYVNLYIGALPC